MARHKDQNWRLPEGTPNRTGGADHIWESVHTALLMDIRDEMKSLNMVLHCTNFLTIPMKLDRISQNTAKPKKKRKR